MKPKGTYISVNQRKKRRILKQIRHRKTVSKNWKKNTSQSKLM